MNRELSKDYQRVLEYLESFSFDKLLVNDIFLKQIKNVHRKTYALLVFQAEFEVNKGFGILDEVALKYLKEVTTDVILAFFCYINGTYKPSRLQLRCSIENFIKALLYPENNQIINQKNVSEVFDIASKSMIFSNPTCRENFILILDQYKNLCATVHGAVTELSGTNAMIIFPQYDKPKADCLEHDFCHIIEAFLSILYYTYYPEVYKMHELNRELFLQAVKKKDRAIIQEEMAKRNM